MPTGSFGSADRGEGPWRKVRSEATGRRRSRRPRGRKRFLRLRLSRRHRRDRLRARRVRRSRVPRRPTSLWEQPLGHLRVSRSVRPQSLTGETHGKPRARLQMPMVWANDGRHAHALLHGQRGPTKAEGQSGGRCSLHAGTQQMGVSQRLNDQKRKHRRPQPIGDVLADKPGLIGNMLSSRNF